MNAPKSRGAGVASAAGLLPQIGTAGYSVTKHAAVGSAEWLAITHGGNGIGVSCVRPRPARLVPRWRVRVMGRDRVAAVTVEAVRNEEFLVLPHPAVLDMYRQKGSDYARLNPNSLCPLGTTRAARPDSYERVL